MRSSCWLARQSPQAGTLPFSCQAGSVANLLPDRELASGADKWNHVAASVIDRPVYEEKQSALDAQIETKLSINTKYLLTNNT